MATQQFIVSSATLLRCVKEASATIEANPTVPILGNVRWALTRDGGLAHLHVVGSNLQTELVTTCAVEAGIGTEDFAICVPAKLLTQTLANLPDQPVTIAVDLDTYGITLKSARTRCKLTGENAQDYPRMKEEGEVKPLTLPATTLRELLAATLPFVSTDISRISMTGVYFHREGSKLHAAATNGHALTWLQVADPVAGDGPRTVLLPGHGPGRFLLGLLKDRDGDVTLELGSNWLRVQLGGTTLRCRLIDERFPDYQNVVPMTATGSVELSRDELRGLVREVLPYSDTTTKQVRIDFKPDELRFSASDYAFQHEAEATTPATFSGEYLAMGFGTTYLQTLLGALPAGPVTIEVTAANRAAVFRPKTGEDGIERLAMLMPQLLNNY